MRCLAPQGLEELTLKMQPREQPRELTEIQEDEKAQEARREKELTCTEARPGLRRGPWREEEQGRRTSWEMPFQVERGSQ